MTDSHDYELTDKEHEALVAISEHAIAPPLSPAANAVLSAFGNYAERANYGSDDLVPALAEALKAAALYCSGGRLALMVIAAELESLR